jgi:hypothetical protein
MGTAWFDFGSRRTMEDERDRPRVHCSIGFQPVSPANRAGFLDRT